MLYNPNYLQGSAMAALTWIVYDVCLTLDREIVSVWRSSWSLSKVLFLFSRYHTILSLGFFLMECIGTKHFLLPLPVNFNVNGKPPPPGFFAPCIANLPVRMIPLSQIPDSSQPLLTCSIAVRLAVYGWGRKIVALTLFLFCAETVIGLGTTVISLLGGSKRLFGSTNILTCGPDRVNVPDVNIAIACVYVGLVIHKALNVLQDIEAADGRPKAHKVSLITYFKASRVTLPIFHLSLYFVVVFMVLLVNLLLVVSHNRFAQLGSAWLLATYSVASTRIFLNLKELTLSAHKYNGATWSEFQQNSALELQLRSGLRTRTSHDR
ncbi:hypothetical protein C8F04DRAFT_1264453 [Mycena alexandri]|uniref:DUF6533 domain-containing protein n=1 Tax=Mycena alexandri TaxID=1745969 RepID=A0AAD6SLJ7_9AGAR|nr:hypothetical protein C8F04DRAFT_1264453 [Mycena alexandri]